jgi:hypothetical protein
LAPAAIEGGPRLIPALGQADKGVEDVATLWKASGEDGRLRHGEEWDSGIEAVGDHVVRISSVMHRQKHAGYQGLTLTSLYRCPIRVNGAEVNQDEVC